MAAGARVAGGGPPVGHGAQDGAPVCGPGPRVRLDRGGGACQLTDELLAAVIAGVRPSRPNGRSQAWETIAARHEADQGVAEARTGLAVGHPHRRLTLLPNSNSVVGHTDAACDTTPPRPRRPSSVCTLVRVSPYGHRIVACMGVATAPRSVQRKRVHDRAVTGGEVEVVEAAQHRLGMRPHRRRIRHHRRPASHAVGASAGGAACPPPTYALLGRLSGDIPAGRPVPG